MSAKLDKIGAEREKARKKRDEWDARYKELDQRYQEQENTEIHDLVHMAGLTPETLAALLKRLNTGTVPAGALPAPSATGKTEDFHDESN